MKPKLKKSSRGRPKTLDRVRTLDVATRSYWAEGVDGISLNEICRRAEVSKPGLYREFGGEDGLTNATLIQYHKQMLTPLHQTLTEDIPFQESLDKLIAFATADRAESGLPNGCLFVNMRNCRDRVGEITQKRIDQYRQQTLNVYEDWVERSKAKGDMTSDIPTQTIVAYIDAQLSNAASLQSRGESARSIKDVLKLSLSVLI